MQQKDMTAKIITAFSEAFPNFQLKESTLEFYCKALYDIESLRLQAALAKLARKCKFFPSIAEIVEESENIGKVCNGMHQLTAAEAWEEAMANAKAIGPCSSEPWKYSSKAVEQAVMQFGGRECFYNLETDHVNTARAQFRDIYNGIIARAADRKRTESAIKMLGANKAQQLVAQLALTSGME